MEGLVEGRIVHFVLDSKVDETIIGEVVCRPAIIVNAWGGKLQDGMVNLQVFLDGTNDDTNIHKNMQPLKLFGRGYAWGDLGLWCTSVPYSETKEVGTWHWPERK